jgi:HEAT repeat protein
MEYSKQLNNFRLVIDALLDNNRVLSTDFLPRFSDLEPGDVALLQEAWPRIHTDRRLALLLELEQLAEIDTLVNFDDVGRMALDDPDPRVRAAAIALLWEDQDVRLIPKYIHLMQQDEYEQVRAAAAKALGLYVYLGELEEISEEDHHRVEDSLLEVMGSNEPPPVRCNALASLGYSEREEVPALIQTAYDSGDRTWVTSALQAMGRSVDQRWAKAVILKIDHPIPEIQFEAVRAAGHLELKAARQPLLEMIEDPDRVTDEVRTAAIWSLTQIGGEEVRVLIEQLIDESEDEDEVEYLEGALENLEFTDGFPLFDMFDFDEEDKPGNVIDLDADDDTDFNDDKLF